MLGFLSLTGKHSVAVERGALLVVGQPISGRDALIACQMEPLAQSLSQVCLPQENFPLTWLGPRPEEDGL